LTGIFEFELKCFSLGCFYGEIILTMMLAREKNIHDRTRVGWFCTAVFLVGKSGNQ